MGTENTCFQKFFPIFPSRIAGGKWACVSPTVCSPPTPSPRDTRNPAIPKALVLGPFLTATGSFGNISWRQQDGHAGPLLSPQCPPLATALGTGGAYLGVKFHLGSQQFEVDAAELTVALTQVALWRPQKASEIQGRL